MAKEKESKTEIGSLKEQLKKMEEEAKEREAEIKDMKERYEKKLKEANDKLEQLHQSSSLDIFSIPPPQHQPTQQQHSKVESLPDYTDVSDR